MLTPVRAVRCLVALVGAALAPQPVAAATITIAQLARTGDAVPYGGTFTTFGAPVWDGSTAAFYGQSTGGRRGIYSWTGGVISRVADTTMYAPSGTNDLFADFQEPSIDAGRITFEAWAGGKNGLYTSSGGGTRVISTANAYPGSGGGNVRSVNGASVSAGRDVYWASSTAAGTPQGVFRHDAGAHTAIAQKGGAAPGGSSYTSFRNLPSYDGTNTAFTAALANGRTMVVLHDGSTGTTVAQTGVVTSLAGGGGNRTFTALDPPAQDGGTVAFRGTFTQGSNSRQGIYRRSGGSLIKIAEYNDAFTSGGQKFGGFGEQLAVDGDRILFTAKNQSNQWGLFFYTGGTLATLVAPGGTVGGLAFSHLAVWNDSLQNNGSGAKGVFKVEWLNGQQGVYQADYANPEPGTLAMLLGGGLILWRRRRP